MATQSLLGVFGPTPEELQRLRAQQDQERAMFAARVSPSFASGYGMGSLLGGVVANIFGIEDPELKKARDIKQIFNELSAEGMTGDQAVMLDQLSYRLQEKGYGNESFTAASMANQARVNQQTLEENRLNAESLRSQREGQDIINRAKVDDINRAKAFNIGNALLGLANNPDLFTKTYEKSIPRLQELGIDTTPLEQADNPEEQIQAVDYLINLGTTQATKSKQQIADAQLGFKNRALIYKQKKDEIDQKLQQGKFDEKTKEFYISERNKMDRALVAANAADKRLGATLQGFEETNRRQMINDIDTTDQTKLDIKNLADDFNLPLVEATKAVKVYQAKVKDYLGLKDDSGQFMYSLSKAQDLAKQDIASAITQEGGILGFGKKGKLGKVKPNDKKIIKLD